MPRLPPRPDLAWPDDGAIPYARGHEDIYFSGDGIEEKRTVFLTGCHLPDAWSGRMQFSVGELGFGTGLNLLVLWDLWRRCRPSPQARLDYLSFEGALVSPDDAARIHAAWPELAPLAGQLRARWPDRAQGMQRIRLPDNLTLTLAIGDISQTLPEAQACVDAWFLDGFSPQKNPEMWSEAILAQLARLSAPGARAATYTVAGQVRRGLEAGGFSVVKMPGHGRKKERLEAHLAIPRPDRPSPPDQVAIIGAGIAGACAAHAFVRRGASVTVYDRAASPGAGASGNPLALVMPRLDAADSPPARALLEAWLYARRFYPELGPQAAARLDARHLPRGEKEALRFAKLLADPPLDETLMRADGAGLLHDGALAIRPEAALHELLAGAHLRLQENLSSPEEAEADLVIICAGADLPGLTSSAPPLTGRLGQVESMRMTGAPFAIADGGYALRAFDALVFGATFEAATGPPAVSEAARAHNLSVLSRLCPDIETSGLVSRAAVRATTPDRLPFAGAMPGAQDVRRAPPASEVACRLIGGLGSRGFLWAPLLAEIIASEAFAEPAPVERSLAACLDPGRFRARAIRRGG